ncbi:hypothetical protein DSM25559_0147 [Agrobacterium rosae]|uniref:Uncharacterized protein n=1 Tax=Agrobacterium rosae TaxID=1972867 RepID=A0A1R3T6Z9_9HYPH|nr:hypothetical protein DSM25559_0147 [Agrobacterium rosae]
MAVRTSSSLSGRVGADETHLQPVNLYGEPNVNLLLLGSLQLAGSRFVFESIPLKQSALSVGGAQGDRKSIFSLV